MRKAGLAAGVLAFSLMVFGLVGCNSSQETIVGKVTAVDGTNITLALGEFEENDQGDFGGRGGDSESEPPAMPDGDANSSDASSSDASGGDAKGGTPPEKPEGDNSDNNNADGGKGSADNADSNSDSSSSDSDSDSSAANSNNSDSADGNAQGGTPPEKPEGEDPNSSDGESSENGQGDPGNGEAPSDMKGGMRGGNFTENGETVSIDVSSATFTNDNSDIQVGDIVTITLASEGKAETVTIENVRGAMGGSGNSGEVNQGSAANTIDSDGEYSDETYTSTGDDENALRLTNSATVSLSGVTVDKSAGSSSNVEDGDFYGMNAALLATDGAQVTITGANVKSNAQNGNGVFSYGEGTVVNISDSTIDTSADNSGGIQTTGGATMNASNLTVNTSGNSAAAIRSDRGGGSVNVEGGTYTSNGTNSPAVYSTANISVTDATLSASSSEALVIEGQNSIALSNCDVTGNMSDTEGSSSNINVHNVMIYQSMSGDAEQGTSTFSMEGGTLTSNNGDMFYVTNTHSVMTLKGANLINKDDEGRLLLVSGNDASNGWGTAGKNGGQLELTADSQTLEGAIEVDSISTLQLDLSNGSTLTGTINIIDNEQGGDAVDNNAVVTIDEGSTWNLTGDCKITSIDNKGTINFNGHSITLSDGTVLS